MKASSLSWSLFSLHPQAKTIREFDERFTSIMFGYPTNDDYYHDASPCHRLKSVQVPMLCLNAADDVFSPSHGELSAASPLGFLPRTANAHGASPSLSFPPQPSQWRRWSRIPTWRCSSRVTAATSASWRGCGRGRAPTWTECSSSSPRPSLNRAADSKTSPDKRREQRKPPRFSSFLFQSFHLAFHPSCIPSCVTSNSSCHSFILPSPPSLLFFFFLPLLSSFPPILSFSFPPLTSLEIFAHRPTHSPAIKQNTNKTATFFLPSYLTFYCIWHSFIYLITANVSLYVTTPLWLLPSLAKAFDPWLIFRVHFLAIRFQGNMARLSSFCSQFKSWTWNYSLSTQTVGILALRDPLHFWKKKQHFHVSFYLVSCNCFLIFFFP